MDNILYELLNKRKQDYDSDDEYSNDENDENFKEVEILGIQEVKFLEEKETNDGFLDSYITDNEENEVKIYHDIFCKINDIKFRLRLKIFEGLCSSGYCMASTCTIDIKKIETIDVKFTHLPIYTPLIIKMPIKIYDKNLYNKDINEMLKDCVYDLDKKKYKIKHNDKEYELSEINDDEKKILLKSINTDIIIEWDEKIENFSSKVFKFSVDGGDDYYPSGSYRINFNLFNKTCYYKEYRNVIIFLGDSGLGKSYLSNSTKLKSYETDSSDKLKEEINDDIIVLGNKYKFTIEEIKERIVQPANITICKFLDNGTLN